MSVTAGLSGLFPLVGGALLRTQVAWLLCIPLFGWLTRHDRSGRVRVRLYNLCLLGLPVLMFCASILATGPVGVRSADWWQSAVFSQAVTESEADDSRSSLSTANRPAATTTLVTETPTPRQLVTTSNAPVQQSDSLPTLAVPEAVAALLVTLWLLGVFAALPRQLVPRLWLARRLRLRRLDCPSVWNEAIERVRKQGLVPKRVRFAGLAGQPSPFVCGLIHPCVYLPEAASGWTDCQREAALLHELRHLQQHDLWQCLLLDLSACLTWCLYGRTTLETWRLQSQEEGCDRFVMKHGRDHLAYAELLLELSRFSSPLRLPGAQGTVGRGSLERRIELIVQYRNSPGGQGTAGKRRLAVAVALLAATALLAGAPSVLASAKPGPDKQPASVMPGHQASGTGQVPATTPTMLRYATEIGSELTETVRLWSYGGLNAGQGSQPVNSQGEAVLTDSGRWAEYPLHELPLGYPIANQLGQVSMGFGLNQNPIFDTYYLHRGIDISTYRSGDAVVATMDAEVIYCDFDKGLGNYVLLRHGRVFVRYGHLKSFTVKPGDTVLSGQTIGYIGNTGLSTGPHLHYEVHVCESEAALDRLHMDAAPSPDWATVDPLPLLRLGGWKGEDKSAARRDS